MDDEERYLFDLQGYLLVPGLLSAAECDRLNAAVDALGAPPPAESDRFGGFLEGDDGEFLDLIDHPRIMPYLVELLGPKLRLDHYYGIQMERGSDGLELHGGGEPYDPAQYYVYKNGRMYNGLTVVSWALTEVPAGQGGFCAIPGSHKSNVALPEPYRDVDRPPSCLVQVPQPAGSALIFTEALTHGTLPWSAPHQRRSLLYKYAPGHLAWGRQRPARERVQRRLDGSRALLLEPPYVHKRERVDARG